MEDKPTKVKLLYLIENDRPEFNRIADYYKSNDIEFYDSTIKPIISKRNIGASKYLTTIFVVVCVGATIYFISQSDNKSKKDRTSEITETNTSSKNESVTNSKQEVSGNKKQETLEKLTGIIRDWNNALRNCDANSCASYWIEDQRSRYIKNLKSIFESNGCTKTSEVRELNIYNIQDNTAEGKFQWEAYFSYEDKRMFYNNRIGAYDGPYNRWNNLTKVVFEKLYSGWVIKDMKTLEQGKNNKALSYNQWKILNNGY